MTMNLYTNGNKNKTGNGDMLTIRNNKGGITISVPLALLLSFFTIMVAVFPAVMAYGELGQRVTSMEKYFEEAGPRHSETIENIYSRLNDNEKKMIETTTILKEIKEDIRDIKDDIKFMRAEGDN